MANLSLSVSEAREIVQIIDHLKALPVLSLRRQAVSANQYLELTYDAGRPFFIKDMNSCPPVKYGLFLCTKDMNYGLPRVKSVHNFYAIELENREGLADLISSPGIQITALQGITPESI